MNDDIFIIKLRDCFNAGYQMPQFCIDNNIKRPLFIAVDERRADFLWEIFVQFKYDKRITPKFALMNGKSGLISFRVSDILPELFFDDIDKINSNDRDGIICLNSKHFDADISNIIYLDQLTDYFIARTYYEIPLLHFLQRHPKVKLIVNNLPTSDGHKDVEFEKALITVRDLEIRLIKDIEGIIPNLYENLGYNNRQLLKLMGATRLFANPDGSTYYEDTDDPQIGIKNGKRITANQPKNFVNKIYFVGTCHQYGVYAPFDRNIPSYLQAMLNENNLPYRVENEGQFFGSRQQDLFYNLAKLNPSPNDIIFVYADRCKTTRCPFFDISDAFDNHDYKKLWTGKRHMNELSYKILAKEFFNLLVQNNFFKNANFEYPLPPVPHRYGIPRENFSTVTKNFVSKELDEHKQKLRERRIKIGCIVMNANPFTRGHEHLVEFAAARVHKLFVMVVSEDKTEFPFVDRFELVKRGTEKFPNVEVLPSGQFVISQKTFEGYFNKENLQDVQVDSSQDVEIFAREIAPALGVNIRFVGEEPEDTVTKTYNENMKNILPRYGIEYCEIPRKEINGEIVSAKTVRAALKENDLDKLKKFVPATTFEYLREKFFRQ